MQNGFVTAICVTQNFLSWPLNPVLHRSFWLSLSLSWQSLSHTVVKKIPIHTCGFVPFSVVNTFILPSCQCLFFIFICDSFLRLVIFIFRSNRSSFTAVAKCLPSKNKRIRRHKYQRQLVSTLSVCQPLMEAPLISTRRHGVPPLRKMNDTHCLCK